MDIEAAVDRLLAMADLTEGQDVDWDRFSMALFRKSKLLLSADELAKIVKAMADNDELLREFSTAVMRRRCSKTHPGM